MRDYKHIDSYLNKLITQVYPQPEGNDLHGELSEKVINLWMSRLTGCNSVLDLGCGTGFCEPLFKAWGASYEGVCLGEDYLVARENGRNVKKMDFSFLEYPDESFELLFSRHSWEHSPIPLPTLMEWRRVSRQWLGLVLPTPDFYTVRGKNHYNVLYHDQILWLLEVAGWNVLWDEIGYRNKEESNNNTRTPHEYWIFCERKRE